MLPARTGRQTHAHDRAYLDVSEILMTVLPGEKASIKEILESEGHPESDTGKYKRQSF